MQSLDKFQTSVTTKRTLNTLAVMILFMLTFYVQGRFGEEVIGWQGVVAQFQVIVSVYAVIFIGRRGYIVAVCFNLLMSVMATVQVLARGRMFSLPGIIIPLSTILMISIILLYQNRLAKTVEEIIEERARRSKEIVELQDVSIMAMSALAETRDNETGKHIQRTRFYVQIIADYLLGSGHYNELLDQQSVDLMVASAPLHDIGKVGIPDAILLKPGRLTPEEFEVIKHHPKLGYEALIKAEKVIDKNDSFLKFAQEIILYHHERWDGTGYPEGLEGEAIPMSARIMAIADVYDALTSKRCYKEIHSHIEAYQIICQGSGTHFDPVLVEAFKRNEATFAEIARQYKED